MPTQEALIWCQTHAERMAAGAKTYSFKHDKMQSADVYNTGKIGELAVFHWLQDHNFNILHTPFRDSYARFDSRDDFQIRLNGRVYQIEVRTKARNGNPKAYFDCCSDSIKAGLLYVFTTYNRQNQTVFVLGWTDPQHFVDHAKHVWRGTRNRNFKHRVDEFNITVADLLPLKNLVDASLA